jgi:hypothetical protein
MSIIGPHLFYNTSFFRTVAVNNNQSFLQENNLSINNNVQLAHENQDLAAFNNLIYSSAVTKKDKKLKARSKPKVELGLRFKETPHYNWVLPKNTIMDFTPIANDADSNEELFNVSIIRIYLDPCIFHFV